MLHQKNYFQQNISFFSNFSMEHLYGPHLILLGPQEVRNKKASNMIRSFFIFKMFSPFAFQSVVPNNLVDWKASEFCVDHRVYYCLSANHKKDFVWLH